MGKLDGRVVLVTGAARGQGEQEARLFAAEGARGRRRATCSTTRGRPSPRRSGAHVRPPGREPRGRLGGRRRRRQGARSAAIDGLVNNAGILRFNELVDTPLDEFMQVVQVNQVGVFLGIKTLAPEIEAAGGGTIVNTASYTGLTGMAYVGAYAATKHAIVGLTRVAALELAAQGHPGQRGVPGRRRHRDDQPGR